jgi:hypothetical protein
MPVTPRTDPKGFRVGLYVQLRKPHPCGSDWWEITRTGIDFGLKCLGCGHRVMIPRPKFERAVKAVSQDFPGNIARIRPKS